MKKVFNDIFIKNFPRLDLHGFDRDSARVELEDFILDNIKLGNEKVVVIHGIGMNIVRNEVHETLHRNKYVVEYNMQSLNPGCTIVTLKIEN